MDLAKVRASDPGRTDLLVKALSQSYLPFDDGAASRCYYTPGRSTDEIEIADQSENAHRASLFNHCRHVTGFHYCSLSVTPSIMTLGACVPKECQHEEVMNSILPAFVQEQLGSGGVCGRAANYWGPMAYVMVSLTALLVALVMLGTCEELVSHSS
jgi:hypothetical protein